MQAPVPLDVAFLGLVNYYSKYVAQFSSILAPLYIAHKTNDREKPIAFASISLSLLIYIKRAWLSYLKSKSSMITYLAGSMISAPITKPLQHINSQRPIPVLVSARLQRWALTLSEHTIIKKANNTQMWTR